MKKKRSLSENRIGLAAAKNNKKLFETDRFMTLKN